MENINPNIATQDLQAPANPIPGLQQQGDLGIAQLKRRIALLNPFQGPSGLSVSYPDEFEYYAVALEVCSVDTQGNEKVLSYMTFPTMPSSLAKSKEYLSTIKKTASGVFVMRNTTFKPFPITIQGTFGAKLRYVDTQGYLSQPTAATAVMSSDNNSTINVSQSNKLFSKTIKTGYGTLKILEKMLEQAHRTTNNIPNRLYWYNFAFNDMYLVEPVRFSPRQDRATNGMWQYNLELQALAPANSIQSNLSQQQKNILGASALTKEINAISSTIKSILGITVDSLPFNVPNSTQGGAFANNPYGYGSNITNPNNLGSIGQGTFNNKINKNNI